MNTDFKISKPFEKTVPNINNGLNYKGFDHVSHEKPLLIKDSFERSAKLSKDIELNMTEEKRERFLSILNRFNSLCENIWQSLIANFEKILSNFK